MSGRRGRGGSDDGGIGCLVIVVLAVIAMPLVGLYLALSNRSDDGTKAIGWVMVVIGCIFWIYIAAASAH